MADLFDSRKNALNIAKHGLSFDDVDEVDWSTAITSIAAHSDYGEERFITYAMRHDKLHCLIWTKRNGTLRAISFRKASRKERKKYEKEIKKAERN